jgi:hypothetical protein
MKRLNQEVESTDPIRELLRSWAVSASLPPRFQEHVWRRIARANVQPTLVTLLRFTLYTLQRLLSSPKIALSSVTILIAGGMAAGSWLAQVETSRVDEALGVRYVQSVDPYQALVLNR